MWFSPFEFSLNKVIQKWDCYWVLAQVCIAPMLSKSDKILMSSNSKAKVTLPTTEFYTKQTKNRETARKWQKRVWVWCLRLVVLNLSNHADPYFLAWWSPPAQEKGRFKDSKNLKIKWKVATYQERLSTWTIQCIKVTKFGK